MTIDWTSPNYENWTKDIVTFKPMQPMVLEPELRAPD